MNQKQMYYKAVHDNAEIDMQFLEMIEGDDGITNAELERLIRIRPELWGRFSHWIGKLKD